MAEQSMNGLVLDILSESPIAFIPSVGRLANSVTAGLFLSQLLYWEGKGFDKEWVYKTIPEMQKETGLNRSEQERAIKIWTRLGILHKKLEGVPPTRYFQIDTNKLIDMLKRANQKND